ncbi:hypothetical protein Fmac_009129 [Flemingia macrophylla]|uniref:Myb/SANT-like DNA-binding domain-containing protein n=1 Tax=Flemingia macrophylla TaxID=520843 RepID=A0ABD1MZF9_9FABA
MAGRGGYGDANQKVDYVFQVVLMGNSAVGKSQILTHFARNEFSLDSKATIAVEFQTHTLHKTMVLLEMWGEKFLQLGRNSLRSEEWHEVAEKISEELKVERSVMQCMGVLERLKRRYKEEKTCMDEMGLGSCKWAFFKKTSKLHGTLAHTGCCNRVDHDGRHSLHGSYGCLTVQPTGHIVTGGDRGDDEGTHSVDFCRGRVLL